MRGFHWTFDRAFGVFCISLGALYGYGASRLDEAMAFQQVEQDLWPGILSILLVLVGAWIFLDRRPPPAADPTAEEIPSGIAAWVLFAAILASAPVMMYLGFWAGGAFLMAVVFVLKETRAHILRSVICAVGLPAGIYFLFTRVFDQFLPTGELF